MDRLKQFTNIDDCDSIIEKSVYNILLALGENPDRPGLLETPKRVRKAYQEIFKYIEVDNSTIACTNSKSFDIE